VYGSEALVFYNVYSFVFGHSVNGLFVHEQCLLVVVDDFNAECCGRQPVMVAVHEAEFFGCEFEYAVCGSRVAAPQF